MLMEACFLARMHGQESRSTAASRPVARAFVLGFAFRKSRIAVLLAPTFWNKAAQLNPIQS
jgi:hypothetical protein